MTGSLDPHPHPALTANHDHLVCNSETTLDLTLYVFPNLVRRKIGELADAVATGIVSRTTYDNIVERISKGATQLTVEIEHVYVKGGLEITPKGAEEKNWILSWSEDSWLNRKGGDHVRDLEYDH